MPKIVNNPIIISSGGGAALNIEYSSYTPPTGTNKIWVKSEPSTQVDIKPCINEASVGQAVNLDNYDAAYLGFNPLASCALSDGRILLTNGLKFRIYNPSTQTWESMVTCTGDLPKSGKYLTHQITVVNDEIYFIGVNNTSTPYYAAVFKITLDGVVEEITYQYLSNANAALETAIKYDETENKLICWAKTYYNSSVYIYKFDYDLVLRTKLGYTYTTLNSSNSNIAFSSAENGEYVIGDKDLYIIYKSSTKEHTVKKISHDDMTKSWVTCFDSLIDSTCNFYYTKAIEKDNFIYLIGGAYGASNPQYSPSNDIIKYNYLTDEAERIENGLIGSGLMNFPSKTLSSSNGNALCVANVEGRIYMINGCKFTNDDINYGRNNIVDYFDIMYPLASGKLLITTNTEKISNNVPLIVSNNTNINVLVENAMRGNWEGVAEKVNIYKYDETTTCGWKGLNCSDWEW